LEAKLISLIIKTWSKKWKNTWKHFH